MRAISNIKCEKGILYVLCKYVEQYLELVRQSAGLQQKDRALLHPNFTAEGQLCSALCGSVQASQFSSSRIAAEKTASGKHGIR
jgi:hypothetical protein